MKTSALFIIAIVATTCLANQSDLTIQNELKKLQKTGWGKIGASFMELTLQLGGPIDELINAFVSLLADLNFQVEIETYDFTLKTADHNALDASIRDRIATATLNINQATHQIENVLIPLQQSLMDSITYDENLVAQTRSDLERAEASRNAENNNYNDLVNEHEAAIQAVGECIDLVRQLDNDATNLIQVQKTQNHLKKLHDKLVKQGKTEWTEMVKVMIGIAQNFSDQGAVDRVLGMLNTVLGELHTSLENLHNEEAAAVSAYNNFVEESNTTIQQATARLMENRDALAAAQAEEQNQRDYRDAQQQDLDTANEDLDFETTRWENETNIHNTLMAELADELAAVDEILTLASSATISNTLTERLNSM